MVDTHTHTYRQTERYIVGFNVPINKLYVIPETSLSSQSLALVLTTQQEQPRDRIHK